MSPADSAPSALMIWVLLISIGLVTFAIRYIPFALLARLELPHWLKQALVYVPPAVMAAIIMPALFFTHAAPNMSLDIPRLVAALCAALLAWKTRNVMLTIVVGMLILWGMQTLVK